MYTAQFMSVCDVTNGIGHVKEIETQKHVVLAQFFTAVSIKYARWVSEERRYAVT
jgi:hypothetical protein